MNHPSNPAVLSVEHLKIELRHGTQPLVHDLSFDVKPGEFLAVVGESGSGKTMAARAILQLLPPGISQTGGRIVFDGEDLSTRDVKAMRPLRGPGIGMVFQEPMVSLNPVHRIGEQMAEGLRMHTSLGASEIRARILDMLRRVQIADPERCMHAYPHEFSGGMRQRIMLASVMLLKPRLLIADEPTTALDTRGARPDGRAGARQRHRRAAHHPQPRAGGPLCAARHRAGKGPPGRDRRCARHPGRAEAALHPQAGRCTAAPPGRPA
jgi:peptide/nickel transport system ATP-binding protein